MLFFDWRGHLLSRSIARNGGKEGSSAEADVWSLYASSPQSASGSLSGGRQALYRQVRIQGALEGVLAVVMQKGRFPDLFIDRTLDFARFSSKRRRSRAGACKPA